MIGVCIKYMMRNYGSQLQARATVKILEDMGLEYEILDYRKKGIMFKIKAISRLFNPVAIDNFLLSRQKAKAIKDLPQVLERNKLFDAYSKEHFLNKVVFVDYFKQLQERAKQYKAVLTGSDQLWSPAGFGTNFFNLMFVPDNIRKISFASSFGVSKIPAYQRKTARTFLNRIEYISMRENQGAAIVKDLTGRDVPVLMDPVFVYTKEEWADIVPLNKEYLFPYIFCYFLGDNVEYRKRVKEFAEKNSLKIIAINFCNSYTEYDKTFGDITPYDVNPDRFLNLLRGADYICTDSFHGAAFSIIMEKRFVIFNRYAEEASISRNSRISSLCENLNLEQCRGTENVDLSVLFSKKIDYEAVKKKLDKYIIATKEYLNQAFLGLN